MKRKWAVVLAILVLVQALCGFQSAPKAQSAGEKKPTILVESRNFLKNNPVTELYEYLYGECPIEFVALPSDEAEREAKIEEIRAEIEAGGGPDAFILAAHAPNSTCTSALFQNVEQSMAGGAFLPLDTYIQSSVYLDPNAQVQPVFEAGKVNGEQVVLPLLYRVNTYLLDKSQVKDPTAQFDTFDALKNCKDHAILSVLRNHQLSWYGAQFADLETASEFSVPTAENEVADAEIPLVGGAWAWYEDGFNYYAQNENDTYALTVPNDAGGVTAFVTAYAAVNPNTKYAEEVFKYLELFYSDAVQSDNGLCDKETGKTYGVLARSELFALLSADVSTVTGEFAYENNTLQKQVNSRINAVRFYGESDRALLKYAAWG